MSAVDYYMCPTCDGDVRVGSKGCPHCAKVGVRKRKEVRRGKRKKVAAKRREWEQDEVYDGLDLGDEDFDYDEFVAKEFGGKVHKRVGIHPVWWWVAVILVVSMVVCVVGWR